MMTEWKPISEAPKDGTAVLGWVYGGPEVVYWYVTEKEWRQLLTSFLVSPTHFMLIPEGPK